LAESRSKIQWIRYQLKIPGIQFKWQDPHVSQLEGLWARGDRRLSRLLLAAYAKGCKFDGWSDHFNYDLWQEAIVETGVDAQFFTARVRDVAEPLPWDCVDNRVSRSFLKQEWANALEQKLIEDCRQGLCHQCGTCDFEKIEPRTFGSFAEESEAACEPPPVATADFKRLCVYYAKQGQAKYFGHLEMVNIFLRALKRAGIPVIFSQGFHPKPKISFDDPLPIGIESEQERFILSLAHAVDPVTVVRLLNSHLPDGLVITSSQVVTGGFKPPAAGVNVYRVTLQDGSFNKEKLRSFKNSPEVTISRSNRKGKLKKINLKDMVKRIKLLDSKQLQVALAAETGKTLRPAQILGPIFDINENQIKQARVVKLKSGVYQDV
jgi:radical SAM-linked protein